MKEITLRLPRLKRPSGKILMIAGVLLFVLVGAVCYYFWPDHPEGKRASEVGGTQSGDGSQAPETPTYQMLLPAGKTLEGLGGLQRVSPPDKEPVFAFADSIGGVAISVSQQPLPEAFKASTSSELAKLAEQFGTSEKISTDGVTAYIGIAKNGQQSVILAKGELLILIKSAAKIGKTDWTAYLNSLE